MTTECQEILRCQWYPISEKDVQPKALKIKKSNPFLILRREGDGVIPHGLTINKRSPSIPSGSPGGDQRPLALILFISQCILVCRYA